LIFSACIDRLIANRCRTIHLLRCTATLGPPSVRRLASRRCGGIHALLAALHPTDRPPTPLLTTTAQHHAGPLFPHVRRLCRIQVIKIVACVKLIFPHHSKRK